MFRIGDVVEIYSPIAGYKKYHLCVFVGVDGEAFQFIFLNSDDGFKDCFAFDCARLPFLPPSRTGKTVFSFSMLPRYSIDQLKLYQAKKLGELDKPLAAELYAASESVKALPSNQLKVVRDALSLIMQ